MPRLNELIGTAKAAKDQVDVILLKAIVSDSGEARVAASLCLSIAEQFAATILLVEGQHSAQAAIIVRSMLEGLADLLNLVRDPKYLDQMRLENAQSDVVLFKGFLDDNSIREDLTAIKTLNAWRAKALPIRDQLRSEGLGRQQVKQKFKAAGIQSEYNAYRVLCSFAHNQLTTLIARHAGPAVLRYHGDLPEETIKSILSVALAILCKAINALPKFTDVEALEVTTTLDRIDVMWGRLDNNLAR